MKNYLFETYSSSIIQPNFIQVSDNLFVAQFPLMKIIPAKYVIEKALNEKKIQKGSHVVETSSGTYALGMAIVCREHALCAHIITDSVIDEGFKGLLERLNCHVEIVHKGKNHPQILRLKAVQSYLKSHPKSYWPAQYDNLDHSIAYSKFAQSIIDLFGKDIHLVASVGSGSSSCGTIAKLREYSPKIKLFGVDTFKSVLFGLTNGPRPLRGLGNSLLPENLNHCFFDEIHWISANLAFQKTLDFYAKTALFSGPTTGACYLVSEWLAENNPKEKFLFISADSGQRYLSTIYNPVWMQSQGYEKKPLFDPHRVESPKEADALQSEWAYISWGRKTLNEHIQK